MIKHLKFVAAMGAAVAMFGLSSTEAQAQDYSCGTGVSNYAASYSTYQECTGANASASTITTSTAVLSTAAASSANLVAGRVANAITGGRSGVNVAANGFDASTGMSAGGYMSHVGAWVSGSWSDVEDDNASTAFDGDVFTAMAGVDYRVTPKAVLGLSVGYEDADFDTAFNGNTTTGADGSLEGDGYTIAPYIGGEIAPNVNASLVVGYSDIEYDMTRYDPLTGNLITGNTDADRYFVNAAVGGEHMFDHSIRLRGNASIFYANEDKDGFTETESNGNTITNASADNDFGQVSLDAKLGYVYDMIEPYALLGVSYDYAKDEAPVGLGETASSLDDEDFEARIGAGIDFNLGHNVTAGIEGYTTEFRDDYDAYTVQGGLRVEF